MGHKTHPIGLRVGIIRNWDSRWYKEKGYAEQLHEDLIIRRYIKDKLYHAGISRIEIERYGSEAQGQRIQIYIHTARPGIVIGKKGAEVEALRKELSELTGRKVDEIKVDIKEVRKPEVDAQLVAENIALQLEKRVAYRRAMKKAVSSAMRFGAKGIKVQCAGRLAGAEIARREWYRDGRVPLQTLRADIDYGFAEAKTQYGVIGVKVWIYKGDVIGDEEPITI
ncbi:MAG: 30S ribosomal protein S3 [Nitrospirae bacterium]|nr:MAG: 30S ribosomal protein S3 [Nitrospirota bacterium]